MSRPLGHQNTILSRWWIRLCQWLWSKRGIAWSTFIVIIIGIGVNWLTAPTILAGTPLGTGLLWVHNNPLLASCFILILFLLSLLVGVVNRLTGPPQVEPTSEPQQLPTIGDSNAVLFDEAHGQSDWTWHGMPPTIDQGYSRIKQITAQHHTVAVLKKKEDLTATKLRDYAAFVLPIGPGINTDKCKGHSLTEEEMDAIHKYVEQGGGLLVLSYYTGDWHHGANLNDLLRNYGIQFEKNVVMPKDAEVNRQVIQTDAGGPNSPDVVEALPAKGGSATNGIRELVEGVGKVATLWSCSLYIHPEVATAILHSKQESTLFEPRPRGLSCITDGFTKTGNGQANLVGASKNYKVIAVGSWKMFLDSFIDDSNYKNELLYRHVLDWLTAKRGGG